MSIINNDHDNDNDRHLLTHVSMAETSCVQNSFAVTKQQGLIHTDPTSGNMLKGVS